MNHSKQLLALVLFLSFNEAAICQRPTSYLGIKGGINHSSLSLNTKSQNFSNPNYNYKAGTNLEIFIETKKPFSPFSETGGFEFSQQGARRNGFQAFKPGDQFSRYFSPGQLPGHLYANVDKKIDLKYLLVKTIMTITFFNEKKTCIRPYVSIGLSSGYLIFAQETLRGTSIVYKDDQQTQPLTAAIFFFDNFNVRKELQTVFLGADASIGITVETKKIRFYFEGKGKQGLLNINKQSEDGKTYVKSLNASHGLSYNIGQLFFRKI